MSTSKASDTQRLPRSALEGLAPELLHHIFHYLPLRDVLALRQTCITLASIGLDHLGTEIPLVSHIDKFRVLIENAKHPVLSKRKKSLFYMCDRLRPVSYSTWLARQSIPSFPGASISAVQPSNLTWTCVTHTQAQNTRNMRSVVYVSCSKDAAMCARSQWRVKQAAVDV